MRKFRLAYFAHSFRSDWNNGNAHFLRGLMRATAALGHTVRLFEPETGWSIDNLRSEQDGDKSIAHFERTYSDLHITTYREDTERDIWRTCLRDIEIVILHEWNPPALAKTLLDLRGELGFRLLFHDTHHRATSSPAEIARFGLQHFDGILAFGESLRTVYKNQFNIQRVWTLHEAADTTVFSPQPAVEKKADVLWIGNWGDEERTEEIREFLLHPATLLHDYAKFTIHGVRYPTEGLCSLKQAGIYYGGYLPNLSAPAAYASAQLTVHIPRQQYNSAMTGIPTIRVFEALACGIPLISAPWQDTEHLFRPGDFLSVANTAETITAMQTLLANPSVAAEQAQRGLETVLARHTCNHRAQELTQICEEISL